MFGEINVSALLSFGKRQIPVVLGESLFEFVPFRIIWRVVGRTVEAHARNFVMEWRLREREPAARCLNVVPADTMEKRKSCEDDEYTGEVKNKFPISPWDQNRPDRV